MSSKLVQKQGRNNPAVSDSEEPFAVSCVSCTKDTALHRAQVGWPHHTRAEPSAVPEALQGTASLPSIPFSPSHVPSQHFCPPGLSDEHHLLQAGFRAGRQPVWTEIFSLAASPATAAPAMKGLVCALLQERSTGGGGTTAPFSLPHSLCVNGEFLFYFFNLVSSCECHWE